MRRTAYWVLGFLLLATAVSVLLISQYRTPLVYTVVKNATLQKATTADRARIETAFERARKFADQHDRDDDYVKVLFAISQRAEKVQRLSKAGSDEVIRVLDAFSQGVGSQR